MIGLPTSYSSIRTNPIALVELASAIKREYSELLDLRERVKKAEAAKRSEKGRQSKACSRPVTKIAGRVVMRRRPIARPSREISKRELYSMLEQAVRNTRRSA